MAPYLGTRTSRGWSNILPRRSDLDMTLFPCTLVGSYPQPDWLIDKKALAGRFPPRTRAKELWRVGAEPYLEDAAKDAPRVWR